WTQRPLQRHLDRLAAAQRGAGDHDSQHARTGGEIDPAQQLAERDLTGAELEAVRRAPRVDDAEISRLHRAVEEARLERHCLGARCPRLVDHGAPAVRQPRPRVDLAGAQLAEQPVVRVAVDPDDYFSAARTSSAIRSALGTTASSSSGVYGMSRLSGKLTARGRVFQSTPSIASCEIRLAPQPPTCTCSSAITSLPVFSTLARTVSVSSGRSQRSSTTSAAIPSAASCSAAA